MRSFLTLEEHQKYARDNNLTTFEDWVRNNKTKPNDISSNPFAKFNITVNKFFDKPKIVKATLEEHRQYAREHNFTNSNKWKDDSKNRPANMYSVPWDAFGITSKKFFAHPKHATLKQHQKFAKSNKIRTALSWGIQDNRPTNMYVVPWVKFGITVREFFNKPKKGNK